MPQAQGQTGDTSPMITVDIPGVGKRAFPVSMAPADIEANAQTLMREAASKPRMSTALSPEQQRMQDAQEQIYQQTGKRPSAYQGQLADVGSFKIDPEDLFGLPVAGKIASNVAGRFTRGVDTLASKGSLFKAIGEILRPNVSTAGPAVLDTAEYVRPPSSSTGTSFSLPNQSPLPPSAPFRLGPNAAQKFEGMGQLQKLEDMIERVTQGGQKIGEEGISPVRRSFKIEPTPPNLQRTRLGGPRDTASTVRKGVKIEE